MESQPVHIRHVTLWEVKEGNSVKATTEKIYSVYGEGLTTDSEKLVCKIAYWRYDGTSFQFWRQLLKGDIHANQQD